MSRCAQFCRLWKTAMEVNQVPGMMAETSLGILWWALVPRSGTCGWMKFYITTLWQHGSDVSSIMFKPNTALTALFLFQVVVETSPLGMEWSCRRTILRCTRPSQTVCGLSPFSRMDISCWRFKTSTLKAQQTVIVTTWRLVSSSLDVPIVT